MPFRAFHGVDPQERTVGGRYLVDVTYSADTGATETDNIDDTINYAEVYNVVKREMMHSSHLIEHLAARILKSLKNAFPAMQDISVKVSKLHPPVDGIAAEASVSISE